MYALNIFQTVVAMLVSMIVALPHNLMVNNEFVRDVGVIYPNNR